MRNNVGADRCVPGDPASRRTAMRVGKQGGARGMGLRTAHPLVSVRHYHVTVTCACKRAASDMRRRVPDGQRILGGGGSSWLFFLTSLTSTAARLFPAVSVATDVGSRSLNLFCYQTKEVL